MSLDPNCAFKMCLLWRLSFGALAKVAPWLQAARCSQSHGGQRFDVDPIGSMNLFTPGPRCKMGNGWEMDGKWMGNGWKNRWIL
jgi:hypothetical protein